MSFMKSETTLPILMMVVLVGVIMGVRAAFPDNALYQYVAGGVSIIFILFMIPFLGWEASRLGNEFTHILMTIRVWSSGYPIQRDFYIENVDFKDLVIGKGALAGLRWFIYLVPTRTIDLYDRIADLNIGKCEWHLLFLPDVWSKVFTFRKREYGAYILTQVYTHDHSEIATAYLAPVTYDPPGIRIPMYFVVEATGMFIQKTKDWRAMMEEIAQLDMTAYINQNRTKIEEVMRRIHDKDKPLTPEEDKHGTLVVVREK